MCVGYPSRVRNSTAPVRHSTALVLGCLCVACNYDPAGLPTSTGPTLGTNGGASTATATTISDAPTSSADPTMPDSGDTIGVPPTSSGTTGPGDPTSTGTAGTGSSIPPLIDLDLLARWYIDDAVQGQNSKTLHDVVPPSLDLMMQYQGNSPVFESRGGNLGLRWTSVMEDGRGMAPIARTKIETVLGMSRQATFEFVVAIDAVEATGSRIIHIGNDNEGGNFAISTMNNQELDLRWGNGFAAFHQIQWTGDRQVLHVVVDTNAAVPEERLLVFLDGVVMPPTSVQTSPTLNQVVPLENDDTLTLGNRSDGFRSFQGRLQYAAIYTRAFTQDQVVTNGVTLALTDDPS